MNKNIIIAAVLVAVLLSGLVFVAIKHEVGKAVGQLSAQSGTQSQKFGAAAGPDMPFLYLRWGGGNGMRSWPTSIPLTTATNTPCAILSPAATSTLVQATLDLRVASSVATVWDIAKSSVSPNATTTAIGTAYDVGGGAQAYIQASTSPAALALTVFAPNTWLVFGVRHGITAGEAAGTGFVPSGACGAEFKEFPRI